MSPEGGGPEVTESEESRDDDEELKRQQERMEAEAEREMHKDREVSEDDDGAEAVADQVGARQLSESYGEQGEVGTWSDGDDGDLEDAEETDDQENEGTEQEETEEAAEERSPDEVADRSESEGGGRFVLQDRGREEETEAEETGGEPEQLESGPDVDEPDDAEENADRSDAEEREDGSDAEERPDAVEPPDHEAGEQRPEDGRESEESEESADAGEEADRPPEDDSTTETTDSDDPGDEGREGTGSASGGETSGDRESGSGARSDGDPVGTDPSEGRRSGPTVAQRVSDGPRLGNGDEADGEVATPGGAEAEPDSPESTRSEEEGDQADDGETDEGGDSGDGVRIGEGDESHQEIFDPVVTGDKYDDEVAAARLRALQPELKRYLKEKASSGELIEKLETVSSAVDAGKDVKSAVDNLSEYMHARRGTSPSARGGAAGLIVDAVLGGASLGLQLSKVEAQLDQEEALDDLIEAAKDLGVEPYPEPTRFDVMGEGGVTGEGYREPIAFIPVENVERRIAVRENLIHQLDREIEESLRREEANVLLDLSGYGEDERAKMKSMQQAIESEIEALQDGEDVPPGGRFDTMHRTFLHISVKNM